MSKKCGTIITVLTVISICLAAASFVLVLDQNKARKTASIPETNLQYVMYVGTNDKDTYAPRFTHEEAIDIVDRICLKHFDGYTIQEATGSWIDETGTPTHEYTIVCFFDSARKEAVYAAADEIIEALNQNTVLIEVNELSSIDYYSGKQL